MLLYDKKENSIDIYTIKGKAEELKKYRKGVLQRHKNDNLFYYLRTNCEKTIERFSKTDDINIRFLNYDNSSPLDVGTWSDLCENQNKDKMNTEIQKNILEKYVNGSYDNLIPTRTFEFIWEDDLDCEVHRLLKPEKAKKVYETSQGIIWQMDNIINLPRNLYLLQLLQLGKYEKLTHEDISRQLKLFDIEYLKNVKISDIEEFLSTGLVSGSIKSVLYKAEVGSKILQKRKII